MILALQVERISPTCASRFTRTSKSRRILSSQGRRAFGYLPVPAAVSYHLLPTAHTFPRTMQRKPIHLVLAIYIMESQLTNVLDCFFFSFLFFSFFLQTGHFFVRWINFFTPAYLILSCSYTCIHYVVVNFTFVLCLFHVWCRWEEPQRPCRDFASVRPGSAANSRCERSERAVITLPDEPSS